MFVINSFFSAFLMYSKIPMPRTEWKEENRRYALCFFPLIGAVCGGLIILWYYICSKLNIGNILFAAGCTAIPAAVTGGIHLDGFCDVCDAKSSWGGREKMLEIMSDSHIGAFAAIKLCLYLIIQTALFTEIFDKKLLMIFGAGMVLSRALSGLAAVTFKSAKNSGALQNFVKSAHKRITVASEIFIIILNCGIMIISDSFVGIAAILGGFTAFAYYRIFSYRRFGGITGDLAGWFLQICELAILLCIVLSHKLMEVL